MIGRQRVVDRRPVTESLHQQNFESDHLAAEVSTLKAGVEDDATLRVVTVSPAREPRVADEDEADDSAGDELFEDDAVLFQ